MATTREEAEARLGRERGDGRGSGGRWTALASAGAVATAFLASACCLGPLVLALLGLGGAGLLIALEPYRPYLLVATFGLLGAGFYLAYRPRPASAPAAAGSGDACECPVPRASRAGRALLWVAAVVALAFLAFPYVAPWIWS